MDNKSVLIEMIRDFYPFAKGKLGFSRPVRIFLNKDFKNAKEPLGNTGYYDPSLMEIKLYYVDRHPKDVLRSLAHELMHHKQNCDGRLNVNLGEGDVESNKQLAQLEEEANQAGFLVRQWEEQCKKFKQGVWNLNKAEGEYMEEKRNLQESKMSKEKERNPDLDRDLSDLEEKDTIKDHYSRRAEKVFEKLTQKWQKSNKESEVK